MRRTFAATYVLLAGRLAVSSSTWAPWARRSRGRSPCWSSSGVSAAISGSQGARLRSPDRL